MIQSFQFPRFLAEQLSLWTQADWIGPTPSKISGFSHDTRQLQAGDCFIALKTDYNDGHLYLEEAQNRGASSAIVSCCQKELTLPQLLVPDPLTAFQKIAAEHRNLFQGKVIGVTGSCGKTSTKDLIHLLLGKEDNFKTKNNLNNTLGLPLMLTQIDDLKHKAAVLEVGINEPGEMEVMAKLLKPDIAVLTLVAPVHLEKLKSLEEVARQKSMLLQYARPNGMAFFPEEILSYAPLQELQASCTLISHKNKKTGFSKPGSHQIVFDSKLLDSGYIELYIAGLGESERIFILPYKSEGMLQNAVLAISIASYMGISEPLIQERLLSWSSSQLRGEVFQRRDQWVFADCYNANPIAMQDALVSFSSQAPENLPRLYLIGGMSELGEQARFYHYQLGKALNLRKEDHAVLLGPYRDAVKEGLLHHAFSSNQISFVDEVEEMQSYFDTFKGAIFIKGSKGFRLWTLLPKEWLT